MSISALYPVLFPMDLLSMEPWAAAKKTFIQCGGAPNVASVTSIANDKGDNEMIVGAVHRSPGISIGLLLVSCRNQVDRCFTLWSCKL